MSDHTPRPRHAAPRRCAPPHVVDRAIRPRVLYKGVGNSPGAPPFASLSSASYHYGERFAATVRIFQEMQPKIFSLDVAPVPTEQLVPQEQPLQPRTREQERDMAKSISLALRARKQKEDGLVHDARKTALECLGLTVRYHSCLLQFLKASNDLGLDKNVGGSAAVPSHFGRFGAMVCWEWERGRFHAR